MPDVLFPTLVQVANPNRLRGSGQDTDAAVLRTALRRGPKDPGRGMMKDALLYLMVVLVWGTSWFAITFQLGVVPVEASVAYRFIIAAALMFGWAIALGLPLRFALGDHGFIALQGALIFSTNFFLFYMAAEYLTSGLLAVMFATASVLTMTINSLFHRRLPPAAGLLGAACGVTGIAVIFWPEVAGMASKPGTGTGLALALAGTLSFAFGGLVTARNQAAGLSVRGSTAWAMLYGALLLSAMVVLRGAEFSFEWTPRYIISLAYLAMFSSVIAFACYFTLLNRIGPESAAYATVLFPIVALTLSTVFEGYRWTPSAALGVALTLTGVVLVLRRRSSAGSRTETDDNG